MEVYVYLPLSLFLLVLCDTESQSFIEKGSVKLVWRELEPLEGGQGLFQVSVQSVSPPAKAEFNGYHRE
jgi:hypothetical protein